MSAVKFEPDKNIDGECGCTNAERAERAFRTLLYYQQHLGESGKLDECTLRDLISDLGHYADQSLGVDFEQEIQWAINRWQEER
jgi:hypothetical protein